jgi:hypothetical protein
MPPLEITRAALAPEHARATQEYLMAVRVWPAADRADRRAAFLKTCDAARLIDEAKAVPAILRVEMLEQAFRAKPPEDFEPELTLRIQQGLLVGTFYAETIVRYMAGQRITIKEMLSRFTDDAFRQLHPVTSMRQSRLEKLLHEYRPAATLLAAASLRHFDPTVVPRDGLAEFLGTNIGPPRHFWPRPPSAISTRLSCRGMAWPSFSRSANGCG